MKEGPTRVKVTAEGREDFLDHLGLAFIVLKLCGVVDWNWAWVLAPIWAPAALVALVALAILAARLFTE